MSLRPNWNDIARKIGDNKSHDAVQAEWSYECDQWLAAVITHFGADYRVAESCHFKVMTNEDDRYVRLFSDFLERTLKRILTTLKGIASNAGYGKYVAMVFSDADQYYEYVGLFLPEEGEFGLSSGVFLNDGYGHFAFPTQHINEAETIAIHELTHACLVHLPIPLWLNEGLAVLMEETLANQPFFIDTELLNRHRRFWNAQTIQQFWSGSSFQATDEGQELSYHLAHLLVRNLASSGETFVSFVNNARLSDSGDSAARQILGFSLEQLVASFLGDGPWCVSLSKAD